MTLTRMATFSKQRFAASGRMKKIKTWKPPSISVASPMEKDHQLTADFKYIWGDEVEISDFKQGIVGNVILYHTGRQPGE